MSAATSGHQCVFRRPYGQRPWHRDLFWQFVREYHTFAEQNVAFTTWHSVCTGRERLRRGGARAVMRITKNRRFFDATVWHRDFIKVIPRLIGRHHFSRITLYPPGGTSTAVSANSKPGRSMHFFNVVLIGASVGLFTAT